MFDKSVNKTPNAPPLSTLFCIFQMKQSVLPMITFTKSTLVFKENFAKEELTSIVNASFLYLGYTRKDPHWPITIFRVFGFFYMQVRHYLILNLQGVISI